MLVAKAQTLPAPHLCDLDMTEGHKGSVSEAEPQGGVEMLESSRDGA